ncbi:MAG: PepSY domain-containing protein [Paenibacillaceae bacterium]
MNRAIIVFVLFSIFLAGCTKPSDSFEGNTEDVKVNTANTAKDMLNEVTVSKNKAEEIALEYVANESSHWRIVKIEEEDNYWIVRFSPTNSMPELLWLHIDKKTGEIIKVITDS